MDNKAIFKTKHNKWVDKIAFTLPDVAPGSILEISYVEKLPPAALPRWDFQYEIPVGYSECMLTTQGFKYNIIMRGAFPEPKHTGKYKSIYQRWELRNIPALKREPLMPNERIFAGSIAFASPNRDWGHVVSDMGTDQYFWTAVLDNYAKKITTTITGNLKSDDEKVKAICEYVKKEIEWNGTYDHRGSPRDAMEEKRGTSGDMNLLMASMLRNAGIKFSVVAVSTKENGFIDKAFPSQWQFDHVMCLVFAQDTFLVDATDRHLPYNLVPAGCLNYDGLMIDEKGYYSWITFSPVAKYKITAQAKCALQHDGELTGTLSLTHEGYAAQEARKSFSKLGKEAFLNAMTQEHLLDISESSFQDESLEKPFQETHTVKFEGKGNVNGEKIYLNPFLMFQQDENLFVDESRTYPIDFGVEANLTFIGEISIPEGYVVEEMPSSKMINLPGNTARYLLNCDFRQGKIIVTTKLERKKLIYPANEYTALREFFARVVAKNSEMVVLKKAN